MEINRRDMMIAMTAFASLCGLVAEGQVAMPPTSDALLDTSKVFRFDQLPVTHNANGGWSRPVMHGTLPTGEFVEVHMSLLPPGKMPHPPHKHRDTEIVMVRQGKLSFLNEGVAEPVGAGDVIYVASNRMHGWTNVGAEDAMYFIVAVGRKEAPEMKA